MGAIPAEVDPDAGPPLAVVLAHFLVALAFLLAGALVGLVGSGAAARLAHVHLLLVGFVCVTIMGATTQFVPVWSGVRLHSRRLASIQLWLVGLGVAGFAATLLAGRYALLFVPGLAMLAGFWTFAYGLARTLPDRPWDVTERHFALALGAFALVTVLGVTLAVGYRYPLSRLGLARSQVVAAHATLAVFGAVLTTVLGALYQLGPMFTQSDLDSLDHRLRRVEEACYPAGVATLAAGRLVGAPDLARVGAALVAGGLAAFLAVLARRLLAARGEWTPMLARYAVAAVALAGWVPLAAWRWLRAPLAPGRVLGGPGGAHLLAFGVALVVVGTLYHVVPFLVWLEEYSDRVGLEAVPTIDDLYDARLARLDLAATVAGASLVVASGFGASTVPAVGGSTLLAGGVVASLGLVAFVGNLLWVVHVHTTGVAGALVAGLFSGGFEDAPDDSKTTDRGDHA